ncbi:MAG TPA: SpoIIE family protein phosphatase [Thermoleophilia bacterium]|nr:SpoIIE family protein phosphatase [Thermoleophilia bacterium]
MHLPYAERVSMRRRWSGLAVYIVSSLALAAFLAPIGLLSSSKTLLGIPGSGVALIVIVAAVLAGPLVGVLTAVTAGALFFVFVADTGAVGEPIGTLGGVIIWSASALIAGRLADALRASSEQRAAQTETAVLYETLEAGLLPRLPIAHPGVEVVTRYVPSEQRLNLGGDFFDLVTLDDSTLAFIIGDVTGHGPAAAALGTMLRTTWRGLVFAGSAASTVLATLNRMVIEQQPSDGIFVTACLAWLDTRDDRLTYMSVGHPPIVLVGEDGSRPLESHPTLPLGVADHIDPAFASVALVRPWTLFAYTDGLIEGRATPGSPLRYGEDRLLGELSRLGPLGLTGESVNRLLGDTKAANGGPATDDVALIAISRNATTRGTEHDAPAAPR